MIANPRRWTYTARKCYKIGCICSKCDAVPDDLKSKYKKFISDLKNCAIDDFNKLDYTVKFIDE